MKRKIYKSQIQCPNCEGCGRMSCRDRESVEYKLISFDCDICKGDGVIKGDITIEYDDLQNSVEEINEEIVSFEDYVDKDN